MLPKPSILFTKVNYTTTGIFINGQKRPIAKQSDSFSFDPQ